MPEQPDEIDVDEFDDWNDDLDDRGHDSLYLKYMFEGLPTLADLAFALRALADDLDSRAAVGWAMEQSVDSGWVHMTCTW
jgi:hypothetical protein